MDAVLYLLPGAAAGLASLDVGPADRCLCRRLASLWCGKDNLVHVFRHKDKLNHYTNES